MNTSLSFAVVVDSDPTQLALLTELAHQAGLEPRAFAGAEEALAAMKAGAPPDLIVTDLYMPGLDGWRFCRLLRSPEYAAFNRVPILVVSATFAGGEADRIAADLGAEAFLPSPVDAKRFVEQVRAILSGRQARNLPRVLIVEDIKMLADFIRKAFTTHGYEADTALTARAAAEAFNKTAYDVALLDYHLPDDKGDALLDEFRAQRPECVYLMMTGNPRPELALDWMKRGAAAYLRKPFEAGYLLELCARARRERALLHAQDLLEVRTRELRESEKKYREMFESVPVGLYQSTMDGTIMAANQACLDMAQCPAAEKNNWFAQDTRQSYVYPEASQRFRELLKKDGCVKGFEAAFHRCDGSVGWFSNTAGIVYDKDGQAVLISGYLEDITERKRAEEALRKRDVLLAASAQAGQVLLTDPDLDHAIQQSLAVVGQAAGQNRAYIFECHTEAGTGRPLISQRYEWVQAGIGAQIDNPVLQNVAFKEIFPRWHTQLNSGNPIEGLVRNFPDHERPMLQAQDIVSLLIVPIMLDGLLWGLVGFDNCHSEYDWSESERSILSATASAIGAAIIRKRAEDDRKALAHRLRELSAHIQSVREDESRRIAARIHDEVGQLLTAARMDLMLLEGSLSGCPAEAADLLRSVRDALGVAIKTVQKISMELRPDILDNLGLTAAIGWSVDEFKKRLKIPCHFKARNLPAQMGSSISNAVYRIAQECLTNIARHAQATRISVQLSCTRRDVILIIRDNGLGMDAARLSDSASFGLIQMRERALSLGGTLHIKSEKGKGTLVRAAIPASDVLNTATVKPPSLAGLGESV